MDQFYQFFEAILYHMATSSMTSMLMSKIM